MHSDNSEANHQQSPTMTHHHVTKSGKTFLYMTGLCLACVAGYLYGHINQGNSLVYPFSSSSSSLVYNGMPRDVPHVSRSFQAGLPFGICNQGEDCTVISAEDIQIVQNLSPQPMKLDNQETRTEAIHHMCRTYENLTAGELSDDTLKRLFVDDKHDVVYCSIPKAGCTNLKRLLLAATNESINMELVSKNYAHHNNVLRTLYDYLPSDRQRILKSYKKFTFVRDPFIRLLSAYKDKFESLWQYRENPNGIYFRRYAAEILSKYRPNVTDDELESGENVTWSEFILYVTHLEGKRANEHWAPMYKLCAPCMIDYDFVGRIETMDVDNKELLKNVLRMDNVPKTLPHYFEFTTNSSDYTYEAYGDITIQQLRLLWDIFKWDFWIFGYDKPDFI